MRVAAQVLLWVNVLGFGVFGLCHFLLPDSFLSTMGFTTCLGKVSRRRGGWMDGWRQAFINELGGYLVNGEFT